MEWMTDRHWRYETFSFDEPSATFGVFQSAVDLWRGATPQGVRAPDWSDLAFEDLQDWWGWMHIYDLVDADEPRFRVRLWGTLVTDTLGYDATGRFLTPDDTVETADARHITRDDLRFALHLLNDGQIGRGSGPIDMALGESCNYQEIMLPLSRGGECLDKLLFFCSIDTTGLDAVQFTQK